MKWFKFYGQDYLTDSKLGSLNPFQRLMWVTLLCIASQDETKSGVIKHLSESRLVALSGLDYEDMLSMYGMQQNVTLETFCNMGLVTRIDENTIVITNYHKKQTEQSTSSERVAAWRERNKAKTSKVDEVTKETDVTLQSNGRVDKKRVDKNTISFETFWNLYDKKIGLPKSRAKWEKLSLKDQQAIIDYIPKYKIAQPDKKFRKNPETFFNNRSWEDELIEEGSAPQPVKRDPETEKRIQATIAKHSVLPHKSIDAEAFVSDVGIDVVRESQSLLRSKMKLSR